LKKVKIRNNTEYTGLRDEMTINELATATVANR